MDLGAGRELIRVGVATPEVYAGAAGDNPRTTAERIASRAGGPTPAQLERFCHALGEATGTVAVAHGLTHYRNLLDAMHAGQLDLAWLPPVVALRAAARGTTVPIALPVRDGTAYYSTALFARGDSTRAGPSDLRGARAAWVDPHSAAGYLVIRASLRMRGLNLDHLFARETFFGSHEGVAWAVDEGMADVGATYVLLDPRRSKPRRAGWGGASVRMLATAGPIPGDVIAATIRMPVSTIRAVQRALVHPPTEDLRAASNALFAAEGFEEVSSEHLDPLTELLRHLDERPDAAAALPQR